MRLTLFNLYAFLKPKTLTFDPSLSPLCLGPAAVSTFSLYSSNVFLISYPHSLICSYFARSSPISAYFQVVYTISHWIWNFLFFSLKNIYIASDGWIRTLFQKIRVRFLLLLFLIFWDFQSKSHKVEEILKKFSMAIHDVTSEGKNIVLLAAESRQPQVYQLLLESRLLKDTMLQKLDDKGNSALHLAAKLGKNKSCWLIPGAALQMQWELKANLTLIFIK